MNIKIPEISTSDSASHEDIIQYLTGDLDITDLNQETSIKYESNFISQNENELVKIITRFPKNRWNWNELSRNPNISWDTIVSNSTEKWNWRFIACNPSITWEIISKNAKRKWDWIYISMNPNITWEIIQDNPNNILQKKFCKNAKWIQNTILRNPNMTWEILKENFKNIDTLGVQNITLDIIHKNLDHRWNLSDIIINPNIVKEYTIGKKDPKKFIQDIKIVQNNFHHPKSCLKNISLNPGLTWEIIQSNPIIDIGIKWNWKDISSNSNITWEIIQDNLKIPWDWNEVLKNPNITWEIFQDNISIFQNNKILHLKKFSINPNLTLEIIEKNSEISWNWSQISQNQFKKHPTLIEKQRKLFYNIMEFIWI